MIAVTSGIARPSGQAAGQRFGIGVIGLGMGAEPHIRALHDLAETIEVCGAFARTPETRHAFCERHDLVEVASLDAILGDDAVAAVLILTPPNARMDLVRACAAAGKHILMEKPLERTVAAAETVVETCEAAGVALGVVFQHRFRAGALRLRDLLTDGALGPIAAARLTVPWWRDQAYYDEPGRGTYARDGGGVLISQAIHSLDLMLSLTGPVSDVQAVAATTRLHAMEAEDFVAAGLRFASGAMGAVTATTAAFPGAPETLELDCANGSARLVSGALSVHWHDGRTEHQDDDLATGAGADPMAFPHDWHRALIADFVAAVGEGRPPAVTGRQALAVHDLIEAMVASARDGRRVAVKDRA